jgi:hypothetical protein
MTFEHLGWLVVNILLPFFLPILGLLSFKILPLPSVIEVRFIALIKIRGISMLKYITYRFSDAEKARTTMCVVSLTYCAFAFLSLIVIMIFT